jgi:hypothetical protein
LDFYTIEPCRILDTRSTTPLVSGISETFTLNGVCGIPASAKTLSVNVTAVDATGAGNIVLWPTGMPNPGTGVVNFLSTFSRANNAILTLASDGSGRFGAEAFVAGGGTVHLIIDVNGYFQ